MSLSKRIEVDNYEIQTNLYKFQTGLLILFMGILVIMMVLNRYTYSKKHIETEIYNANLTTMDINRIVEAERAVSGDDQVLKIFLAKYVRYRESKMMDLDKAKFSYIQAISSPNIYYRYQDQEMEFYAKKQNYVKNVKINPDIRKLDKGLYQVKFETKEMKSLADTAVYRSSQVATIRFRFIDEYDVDDKRLQIPNFERLNPLKMEITIYSTANYTFKDRETGCEQ